VSIQIIDCVQGTPEWHAARLGIPTASEFATVMAKGEGKTRAKYMRRLAAEIITGTLAETYTNAHMERGHVQEDEARCLYAMQYDIDPQQVGFIRNGSKGCSPDSLIGTDGGLEIKCCLPDIQIERIERDGIPPEYRAQVQGSIWVCEREWWDFMSYSPGLPPVVRRVKRDNGYIANLAGEVDRFNDDLAALVDRVRRYGGFERRSAAA